MNMYVYYPLGEISSFIGCEKKKKKKKWENENVNLAVTILNGAF